MVRVPPERLGTVNLLYAIGTLRSWSSVTFSRRHNSATPSVPAFFVGIVGAPGDGGADPVKIFLRNSNIPIAHARNDVNSKEHGHAQRSHARDRLAGTAE